MRKACVIGAVMHEVVGPDVVRPLGTQADAGAVVQPEPTPLRLFAGHLQPLASPQALDPLVVDLPAGVPQQGRNPPIAVTTVPAGQLDHVRDQAVLVVTAARGTTLGRAMLTQHPAGAALRGPELVTNMVDALPSARRRRRRTVPGRRPRPRALQESTGPCATSCRYIGVCLHGSVRYRVVNLLFINSILTD